MLCALLQRNQNPSGAEQGCAALSRRSASLNHQITRNPRPDFITNTSGFSFRYTQRQGSFDARLLHQTERLPSPSADVP
jgi:hypothetical protein